MATIQVYWNGKFNGRLVTIEESDFDPTIHRLPGQPETSARLPIEAEETAAADTPAIPAPAPRPRKVVIPALEPEKPKGKKK